MPTLRRQKKLFTDISLAFEPHPITKDVTTLSDERAINNSIKNLVLTSPKEVPFQSDVGSTVEDFLFENYDPSITPILEDEIKRTIKYNEPRAEVLEVRVYDRHESNQIEAYVRYKIVGYDEVFTVTQILTQT